MFPEVSCFYVSSEGYKTELTEVEVVILTEVRAGGSVETRHYILLTRSIPL